jgi:hypothetical protein
MLFLIIICQEGTAICWTRQVQSQNIKKKKITNTTILEAVVKSSRMAIIFICCYISESLPVSTWFLIACTMSIISVVSVVKVVLIWNYEFYENSGHIRNETLLSRDRLFCHCQIDNPLLKSHVCPSSAVFSLLLQYVIHASNVALPFTPHFSMCHMHSFSSQIGKISSQVNLPSCQTPDLDL